MFDQISNSKGKASGCVHLTVRKILVGVRAPQGKKNQKRKENNCKETILHVKSDGVIVAAVQCRDQSGSYRKRVVGTLARELRNALGSLTVDGFT